MNSTEGIDMLFVCLMMALTDSQQAHHDNVERAMYQRIEMDEAMISDIWHPSPRLISDYSKAQNCYVKYHLYRIPNCDGELAQVDQDLRDAEITRSEGR
jgi:hypothetical protein